MWLWVGVCVRVITGEKRLFKKNETCAPLGCKKIKKKKKKKKEIIIFLWDVFPCGFPISGDKKGGKSK